MCVRLKNCAKQHLIHCLPMHASKQDKVIGRSVYMCKHLYVYSIKCILVKIGK